jgi:hypothetical protein
MAVRLLKGLLEPNRKLKGQHVSILVKFENGTTVYEINFLKCPILRIKSRPIRQTVTICRECFQIQGLTRMEKKEKGWFCFTTRLDGSRKRIAHRLAHYARPSGRHASTARRPRIAAAS